MLRASLQKGLQPGQRGAQQSVQLLAAAMHGRPCSKQPLCERLAVRADEPCWLISLLLSR